MISPTTTGPGCAPLLWLSTLLLLSGVSSFLPPAVVLRTASNNVGGRKGNAGSLQVSFFPQGSSGSGSSMPDNEDASRRRRTEFADLEPLPDNELRRERIERDLENRARFVEFGDELWDLRTQMDNMSSRLHRAVSEGSDAEVEEYARDRLRDFEQQDPELVYMLEVADMEDSAKEGRMEDAETHHEKALVARSCLPHFNLEGLWVGKYGSHGYELINITYVGDTLIASKVTGDKNVPRSETTFQVDLHPLRHVANYPDQSGAGGGDEPSPQLQPIVLTDKAAKKWGTTKLPRYAGLGQVAEEGFRNNQWMSGQLIVIGDDYFSFAWIPIEEQIFFGRPSPELALRMLRESGVAPLRTTSSSSSSSSSSDGQPPPTAADDDDVERQVRHATRCLEATHDFEDLFAGDPTGCIWHGAEAEGSFLE